MSEAKNLFHQGIEHWQRWCIPSSFTSSEILLWGWAQEERTGDTAGSGSVTTSHSGAHTGALSLVLNFLLAPEVNLSRYGTIQRQLSAKSPCSCYQNLSMYFDVIWFDGHCCRPRTAWPSCTNWTRCSSGRPWEITWTRILSITWWISCMLYWDSAWSQSLIVSTPGISHLCLSETVPSGRRHILVLHKIQNVICCSQNI